MIFFLHGMALGLAYAAPIGAQNIFVLNSALSGTKQKAFETAFFVSLADISLSVACFFGIGLFLNVFPIVKPILYGTGSVFLILMSIKIIRNSTVSNLKTPTPHHSRGLTIQKAFVLTWFNAQAIMDGTMLFGSYRASLDEDSVFPFVIGMIVASPLWFFAVTAIVNFSKTRLPIMVFTCVNIISAIILFLVGVRFLFDFIEVALV